MDSEARVQDDVKIFRKRLMRWKAVGVWLVVIFVGLVTFSAGRIKYKLLVKGYPKNDPSLHKYVILTLVFGGLSILCQIVACCIMLSATVTMDKMRRKNNFDSRKFEDIKMNLIVSVFICVGYAFDYSSDVTVTMLLLNSVIDFTLEQYIVSVNRIVLVICLFVGYSVLMKIFMTY